MSEHDTNLSDREREIMDIAKTLHDGTPIDWTGTEEKHRRDYLQVFTSDGTRLESHPIEPDGEDVTHRHSS